jgi:hypothetical protein
LIGGFEPMVVRQSTMTRSEKKRVTLARQVFAEIDHED